MSITDRLADILREYRDFTETIREVERPPPPQPAPRDNQPLLRPADQQRASRPPAIADPEIAGP